MGNLVGDLRLNDRDWTLVSLHNNLVWGARYAGPSEMRPAPDRFDIRLDPDIQAVLPTKAIPEPVRVQLRQYRAAAITFSTEASRSGGVPILDVLDRAQPGVGSAGRPHLMHYLASTLDTMADDFPPGDAEAAHFRRAADVVRAELVVATTSLLGPQRARRLGAGRVMARISWNESLLRWMAGIGIMNPAARHLHRALEGAVLPPPADSLDAATSQYEAAVEAIDRWRRTVPQTEVA